MKLRVPFGQGLFVGELLTDLPKTVQREAFGEMTHIPSGGAVPQVLLSSFRTRA